ncbi:MAG: HU family DNA-binding protein [Pseudomonadota bacterium]
MKIEKPFTTAQVVSYIADQTGLTKNDVKAVLESLEELIGRHLKTKGVQKFNFLGMAQFKIDRVPRRAARKGRNPATGEEITIAAKPAHNKAKVRVLKKLKDLA